MKACAPLIANPGRRKVGHDETRARGTGHPIRLNLSRNGIPRPTRKEDSQAPAAPSGTILSRLATISTTSLRRVLAAQVPPRKLRFHLVGARGIPAKSKAGCSD